MTGSTPSSVRSTWRCRPTTCSARSRVRGRTVCGSPGHGSAGVAEWACCALSAVWWRAALGAHRQSEDGRRVRLRTDRSADVRGSGLREDDWLHHRSVTGRVSLLECELRCEPRRKCAMAIARESLAIARESPHDGCDTETPGSNGDGHAAGPQAPKRREARWCGPREGELG
jgi:hypothetical protein